MQVKCAKICGDVPFGSLCFIFSIISLGFNLAFLADLFRGNALEPALGILNVLLNPICWAQINSAGGCCFNAVMSPPPSHPRLFYSECCSTRLQPMNDLLRSPVDSGDGGPDAIRMRVGIEERALADRSDVCWPRNFRSMEHGW